MQFTKTNRGFAIARFSDRYDNKCSLQKSSLATEDCIWLGVDETAEGEKVNQRMHLTRQQAIDLLPALATFIATGELPDQ